jgi:hypothetical protein
MVGAARSWTVTSIPVTSGMPALKSVVSTCATMTRVVSVSVIPVVVSWSAVTVPLKMMPESRT